MMRSSASLGRQPRPPPTGNLTSVSSPPARRQSNASNTQELPPIWKATGLRPPSSQRPVTSITRARRGRSPIFWGAVKDAFLYAGPLGEPIGTVPAGSVLLEASRHRDVFGGWWVSTRCEDGSLGWIAYSGSNGILNFDDSSDTSPWQPVYDTRATPDTVSGGNGTSSPRSPMPSTELGWRGNMPAISITKMARSAANHFLFLDAELYTYYWNEVHSPVGTTRDWNLEYQRAVEQCCLARDRSLQAASIDTSSNSPVAVPEVQLEALIAAFREEVERTVVQISREATLPPSSRQIPAHPRFPDEVYFHRGILLRRCVDTADGSLGGDEMAMKCGRAIYRHQEMIALIATQYFLYTPLHAFCTFGGFSFLCTTIPPYETRNLVEADRSTVAACSDDSVAPSCPSPSHLPRCALISELLRNLGDALRLKGGVVPREWRVYTGRDRRLYLSRTHRLLPPVLPLHYTDHSSDRSSPGLATSEAVSDKPSDLFLYASVLRYRVRPEVFFAWETPWPANECFSSPPGTTEAQSPTYSENADELVSHSWAAGSWIKSDGITRVAGTLGFQFPVAAPLLPLACCNLCDGDIDTNELRFVVCANRLQCCHVCMHCHAKLMLDHAAGENAAADPLGQMCPTAVRCGAGCRKAGSFLMIPTLSELMHANGLNLRYLAYVLHRLPLSTRAAVEHWCQIELVARTAKHLLQQDLRCATTPVEARKVCEVFFTSLLHPASSASTRFWSTRLGPALHLRFSGACERFILSLHTLRLLAERVSEMAGITLSEASLTSLGALTAQATTAAGYAVSKKTSSEDRPEEEPPYSVATMDARGAFIEIEHIGPITHVFPASQILLKSSVHEDKSVETFSSARKRAERLLLFWIGYTPDGADDALQPFYLDEKVLKNSF